MESRSKIMIPFFVFIVGINLNIFAQWTQYGPFNSRTINDVAISNNNYVFAAPQNGGIYRSSGISNNWETSVTGLPSPTLDVKKILIADNWIFINGGDGVYRYIEEAMIWEKVFANSPSVNLNPIGYINGILFATNLTIIPGFTSLFRSLNFGIDWEPCDSGVHGISVRAINYFAGSLFITTDSGVYISTDLGTTWFTKNPEWNVPTQNIVSNASAILVTSTYLTGNRSYRSIDSGKTWQLTHYTGNLTSTSIGVYQGLLLRGSFYGGLDYSSDNGETWVGLFTIPWHTPSCIVVKGDTLIIGEEYYSHEWGTGGLWVYFYIPTKIRETETPINTFSLSNNYPNPFNPTTKIEFTIPTESQVEIKVYNFLGIEMATLLNEKREAGKYEVNFDGTDFASGVYFYSLQTSSSSQLKKMVLIK